MKYLLVFVIISLLFGGCDESFCPNGEYGGELFINTPSDLSNAAECVTISNNLYIECPACIDLDGLSSLTTIKVGDLAIINSTDLTNLEGLSSLTSLDGGLIITGNDSLTSLIGLGNIPSLDWKLKVVNNDALTSLDGLNALTVVNWDVKIFENDALPDCEVCDLLDLLSSESNNLEIYDNLDDDCSPVPEECPEN